MEIKEHGGQWKKGGRVEESVALTRTFEGRGQGRGEEKGGLGRREEKIFGET